MDIRCVNTFCHTDSVIFVTDTRLTANVIYRFDSLLYFIHKNLQSLSPEKYLIVFNTDSIQNVFLRIHV